MKVLNKWMSRISPSAKKEVETLQQWKEEYTKELDVLANLHNRENLSQKFEDYKDYNPDKAWNSLQSKFGNSGKNVPVKSINRSFLKWAAVFILVVSGFYFWQNSAIQYQAVVHNSGQQSKEVILDDQSKIFMLSNASIIQTGFRKISLQGSGVFDIAKDPQNPFVIETNHGIVKVLGTSFKLAAFADSTWIHVTEGRVELSWKDGSHILTAGDKASLKNDLLRLSTQKNVITSDWEHNILQFDNVELVEALKVVAEHFQIQLKWQNSKPEKGCPIHTRFQNATITHVLKELSLITNFEYTLTDNAIIITRMGC